MEPNVDNARGYVRPESDKELNDANIFSVAELLTPGLNRDDQIRVSMAVKQSKHIIPVESASPVLISNGSEKVLPYHLSNDFCVVAKDDGKVISKDDKTGVIVIEYKNLTRKDKRQIINGNTKVVKNGAGGFFLPSKMNTDKIKPGMTFKKNTVLAFNERFFSSSPAEGVRFNIGTLTKVACMSTYTNFEDGNFVTDKLAKKLGTEICMEATAIVGANSNVDFIVKVGQEVNVNDPLIIYDNSSDDASFNKMLANIGKELKEEITLMGKTPVKSKYAGVIEDIRIYTTVETKRLSPSLKRIVEAYFTKLRAQEAEIKRRGAEDTALSFTEKATVIDGGEDGKIMGLKVGAGVLFRFFIKYKDYLDIGKLLPDIQAIVY